MVICLFDDWFLYLWSYSVSLYLVTPLVTYHKSQSEDKPHNCKQNILKPSSFIIFTRYDAPRFFFSPSTIQWAVTIWWSIQQITRLAAEIYILSFPKMISMNETVLWIFQGGAHSATLSKKSFHNQSCNPWESTVKISFFSNDGY